MQEQYNSTEIAPAKYADFFEKDFLFISTSCELMEKMKFSDIHEFNKAVNRAMLACKALSISLSQHFKRIYIGDDKTLNQEWHFTSLACYLVIINADPSNFNVAKAQLFLFNKS